MWVGSSVPSALRRMTAKAEKGSRPGVPRSLSTLQQLSADIALDVPSRLTSRKGRGSCWFSQGEARMKGDG